MSEATRIRWIRAVVAVAFLVGIALCPRLWLQGRTFPEVPVWSGLPPMAAWLQGTILGCLLVLLSWIALARRPRAAIAVLFVPAGLLALWDQQRWQPWCYQYLCMLIAIGWGSRDDATDDHRRVALDACRLVVAATYLWSGLQKFNASFVNEVFPWLIEPLIPDGSPRPWAGLAFVAAVVETFIGIGLLTVRLRQVAVVLAALMHGFILLSIGPFGHNWNTVVWPWNVAMPVCAWLLFWRSGEVTGRSICFGPPHSGIRWTALALFGLLPALSLFGLWDAYLSATLYSGNIPRASLELSHAAYQRLPQEVQAHCARGTGGRRRLRLRDWVLDDLNVPTYPARRVFRSVARTARERWSRDPDDIVLIIHGRPDWWTGEREETRE